MLHAEQLLQERYRLQEQLGNNASRQTWLAQDLTTAPPTPVIVKFLAFSPQMQWEEFKLFEREAQVLKSLDIPRIPHHRDYFSLDAEAGEGLCWFALVQDYIPGKSLQELLDEGYRFTEEQVRSLAVQVLEILRDLHGFNPPILHRDIKPSNLILNIPPSPHLSPSPDVHLIDFGAVCDATTVEGATFTVVGTAGYAPLEQFWGKTVPASDLYALGATLIHLLTGIPPSELPQKNLRLDFRHLVTLRLSWARWLETLIEPDLERRFSSAEQALTALETGSTLPKMTKPEGSKVKLDKSPRRLAIKIPPRPRSLKNRLQLFVTLFGKSMLAIGSRIFFLLPFMIGIVIILLVISRIFLGELMIVAWIIPPLLIYLMRWSWKQNKSEIQNIFTELNQWIEREIGFSSLIFYYEYLKPVYDYQTQAYYPTQYYDRFFLEPPIRFLGKSIGRSRNHSLSEIEAIEATSWDGIVIEVASDKYILGKHLSELEREWIVREIEDWIAKIKRERSTTRILNE